MNCYSSEQYAVVQRTASYTDTSAVVFLHNSIDNYNRYCESLHQRLNASYSVVVIAVFLKTGSAAESLCSFRNSVDQLASQLPDEVIVNGVIIGVSESDVDFVHFVNKCSYSRFYL